MKTIIIFGLITALCFGSLILLIIRDHLRAAEAERAAWAEAERKRREADRKTEAAKRAAQKAEARRQQEAAAKAAERKAAQQAKEAEKERREAHRQAAAEARHAETLRRREELHQQKMRQLAELQAAQAALQSDLIEEEQPEPRKDPQQPTQPAAPAPFAGQRVAFTGKIPGYTHAEAAKAVELRGGTAYEKAMPAGTTLLVIGQHKPGQEESGKIVKADQWIGQIKKITAAQFVQIITTNPIN